MNLVLVAPVLVKVNPVLVNLVLEAPVLVNRVLVNRVLEAPEVEASGPVRKRSRCRRCSSLATAGVQNLATAGVQNGPQFKVQNGPRKKSKSSATTVASDLPSQRAQGSTLINLTRLQTLGQAMHY